MSDAAAAPVKAATPKKGKKTANKTAPKAHPSFEDMTLAAAKAVMTKKGASGAAIKKYVLANYKVPEGKNIFINKAINKHIESGKLVQYKGKGVLGSVKLADGKKEAKDEKVKAKAKAAKKAEKAKEKKAAKKTATKEKKAAKTAKSPKKAAKKVTKAPAKKSAKKPAKSPKKAAKKVAAKK